MLKNLQFAWRTLRTKPVFTIVAVLSLALGIGANTAIFSVVESSLLRGLPYSQADRLVQLGIHQPCCNFTPLSPGEYHDYSHQSKTLSGLAAYAPQTATLTGHTDAKSLKAFSVTTNYFDVLGAKAQLGRVISPNIDKPSADTRVAVLTDATWRSIFGSDRNILGKDLTLNAHSFRVVGVLQPNQQYPSNAQIFLGPRVDVPEYQEGAMPKNIDEEYGSHWMPVIGRLKPGYSVEQAAAEVRTISASIAALHPAGDKGFYARLKPMQEGIVENIRPAILTLFTAVILLLLIACANLAGLLLARATGRSRELAVRMALGASRWELMRLLSAESMLLALFGGVLGIGFAAASIRLLVHYSPYDLPAALAPSLDLPVLAFCLGATILAALLSGLLPALNASHLNLNTGLKEGSKGTFSGGTHRVRSVLVGAEIAVSVMLLIGASLLIHSFSKLITIDPGFDTSQVLSAQLFVPHSRYPQDAQLVSYWHNLLPRLAGIPGVQSVGLVSDLPMTNYGEVDGDIKVQGQTYGPNHPAPHVYYNIVSPETFETLHIPLLQGRVFTDRDDTKAPPVAVINKRFAETYFRHENALGQRFIWMNHTTMAVVGVVDDVRFRSFDEKPGLNVYIPYSQPPAQSSLAILLRSKPGSSVSVADLRNVVHNLDANIPLNNVQPLSDYLGSSLAARRFLLGLLTTFSGLAVLLAAIGLYAVLAYSVQQRKQEIGIRVALGATSGNVLWLILRECLTIAVLGAASGLLGATWATSFLNSMLYGVTATDMTSYAAAIALILTIALAASLAPALRAARIDPLSALRYE